MPPIYVAGSFEPYFSRNPVDPADDRRIEQVGSVVAGILEPPRHHHAIRFKSEVDTRRSWVTYGQALSPLCVANRRRHVPRFADLGGTRLLFVEHLSKRVEVDVV